MYLCGSTLFLSLILNRTYLLILDTLRLEDKVLKYEGDPRGSSKDATKMSAESRLDEVAQLKRQLEKKDKELSALKSQSEGLRKEYDDLSVKYNQTNPGDGDKKGN